ncbi:hypothetical protein KXD40_006403 [Peronospora effusa]|uniref:Uncharacterized protein n=1 Tax=Peronospora effusa TaxID=542832 RepID=A0A3M6VHY4_9STRA|nr:hypothetical protein DD238_001691 [Peronospora effusa]RQM16976.1 hypothetical protein DD237_001480 [Peronospora effusa]UIZ25831.1 hypothetical protein KXD40_006403 [Peronospora effusa]CAI5706422.1 unnamed protein product [Peronospora effusa]
MATEGYYRHMLAQLQSEFSRSVEAFEKQVTVLTRHNTLLTTELTRTKEQQKEWAVQASETMKHFHEKLERQAAEALDIQRQGAEREEALRMEIAALKSLVQHETDYWTRYDEVNRQEREQRMNQVAQANAELKQYQEQNQMLKNELTRLQTRVDTAVALSTSLEQRLEGVVKEKEESLQALELQVTRYKKKLHDKRVQKKYLTEALVRLQERQEESSRCRTETEDMLGKTSEEKRRVRKRELTLPEELKAATTTKTMLKSKRLMSSRAGTSPTSSSPEISPRSARSSPYQRAPSVATTTPTASDGNSFNSSSGSLRSIRSLRNVTGRRISSRNNSDSDNMDGGSRTNGAQRQGANPSGRLERELNGLRRKLDSCMADTAARW